jgi:hypothetical protein
MAARDDNLSTRINSSERPSNGEPTEDSNGTIIWKGFDYLRGLPVRWTIIVRFPARIIRSSFSYKIQQQCRIPASLSIAENGGAPFIQIDVDAARGAEKVMESEAESFHENVSARIRLKGGAERAFQEPRSGRDC